jgi:hypothetical protein
MDVSFESTEHPTMPVHAATKAVSMAVEDTTVSKVVTTVEATVSFSLVWPLRLYPFDDRD